MQLDLSEETLQSLERDDFKRDAAQTLRVAYGTRAGMEALTRARANEVAGNDETAELWAGVYLLLKQFRSSPQL